MNTQTIKGDWKQLKGHVKEAFGKLTDDDLLVAEGNADQLTGAIQKRYGYTREQAEEAWTSFTERTASAASNTTDDVQDAAEATGDRVRGAASNAADNVRDVASNAVDTVRGAAANTASAVRGAATNVRGEWKQMRGQIKEAFGKLTDDDLLVAEGNADQLTGAIQKRYGYTREQAEQAWTSFEQRTRAQDTRY